MASHLSLSNWTECQTSYLKMLISRATCACVWPTRTDSPPYKRICACGKRVAKEALSEQCVAARAQRVTAIWLSVCCCFSIAGRDNHILLEESATVECSGLSLQSDSHHLDTLRWPPFSGRVLPPEQFAEAFAFVKLRADAGEPSLATFSCLISISLSM